MEQCQLCVSGGENVLLKYSQITGTEEQGGGEAGKPGGVEVWPNPSRGKFQISNSNHQTNSKLQIHNIEVVDLYGKVMKQIVCDLNFGACLEFGARDLEFDISHLPSGIYFLRIRLENQTIVKKIIKL